jgi:hypothetical protein
VSTKSNGIIIFLVEIPETFDFIFLNFEVKVRGIEGKPPYLHSYYKVK